MLLSVASLYSQTINTTTEPTAADTAAYVPREREPDTTALYQGINLKLDVGAAALEAAITQGRVLSFELGMNVNLKNRYLPTLELGYAGGKAFADGGGYYGQGGFAKVGLDLSALKKSGKWNMLLVGLRLGTAVQGYQLNDVLVPDSYWQETVVTQVPWRVGADVWGEVVVGVQVQIYKRFHMGWYARFKILFTKQENGNFSPYYIPGYGYRQETNFGLNYYLGFAL